MTSMIINKPKRKRKRKTSRSSSHHLNLAQSQVVFLVTIISDINKLPCHLQSIIKHSILASLKISRQSKTTFGIWPVRKRGGGATLAAQFRNFFLAKKGLGPPLWTKSVKQFLTPSLIAVLNHGYCSALVFFALNLCVPHPRCKETPPETPRRFPRTLQKIQISTTMIVE